MITNFSVIEARLSDLFGCITGIDWEMSEAIFGALRYEQKRDAILAVASMKTASEFWNPDLRSRLVDLMRRIGEASNDQSTFARDAIWTDTFDPPGSIQPTTCVGVRTRHGGRQEQAEFTSSDVWDIARKFVSIRRDQDKLIMDWLTEQSMLLCEMTRLRDEVVELREEGSKPE